MEAPLVIGDAVTLWTRPRTDLILVFGHGIYDGTTFVTGRPSPVIKLDNNTEVVLHYTTVWCGRKSDVAKTLERYRKEVHVIQWDLDKFLNGSLPEVDPLAPLSEGVGPLDSKSLDSIPEPKTATDKVLRLGQCIALEEKRIAVFNAEIEKSKERIADLNKQKLVLRDALLKELTVLFPGGVPFQLAVPVAQALVQVEPIPVPETQTVSDDVFRQAAQLAAEGDS